MVEGSLAVLEKRKLLVFGGLKGKLVTSIYSIEDVAWSIDFLEEFGAIERAFKISPKCRVFGFF